MIRGSSLNPYGSAAPLVDRHLGDAYNTVKEVADNLNNIIDALNGNGSKYFNMEFIAVEGQTDFELDDIPFTEFLNVFKNNILLSPTSYALVGSVLVLSEALQEGDFLRVQGFIRNIVIADAKALSDKLSSTDSDKGASMVMLTTGQSLALKVAERISFLDFVPYELHEAIRNDTYEKDDPVYNLTQYFNLAVEKALSRPNGAEIHIPAGAYTMDMDLTETVGGGAAFQKIINLTGDGRGATIIRPAGTNSIVLNMLGRNLSIVSDMTIRAGEQYQAECGIFIARSVLSPNANNNKFLNVKVEGNFKTGAVISWSAESSLWFNCVFAPGVSSTDKVGFWTGSLAASCPIDPPSGTVADGPNTDNRMISSEFYQPYGGAECLRLSNSGGWMVDKTGFIVGDTGGGGSMMVVLQDFNGGIFNGPVTLRDCHLEGFGADNYGVYVKDTGLVYVYGISVIGGFAVVDSLFTMVSYEAPSLESAVQGAYFIGGEWIAPEVASGSPVAVDLPIHMWASENLVVFWRTRGDTRGEFNSYAFAKNCQIVAPIRTIGSIPGTLLLVQGPGIPNPGAATYVAPSGGTTVDAEARASLAQLAADVAALRSTVTTMLQDARTRGLNGNP